jgi:hypothetical protein
MTHFAYLPPSSVTCSSRPQLPTTYTHPDLYFTSHCALTIPLVTAVKCLFFFGLRERLTGQAHAETNLD